MGQRVTAISLAFRKGLLTGRNPNLPDLKAVKSALCLVARQNQSAQLQEIENKRVMGSLGLGVVQQLTWSSVVLQAAPVQPRVEDDPL